MLDLQRLLSVLDENKVKYPKKFKNLELNGYDTNRCEDFANDTRLAIESLLARGINNGFDNNIRQAIYDLADMAGDMSKDNIAVKLDSLQDKKIQIMKRFALNKGVRKMADIKGEILKYVDDSIFGAKMLIDSDSVADYNKNILMNSLEMLEELRYIIEDTLDNSSAEAAHRAKYVYGDPTYALCAWRESVARGMISDGINKHLEEARAEAVKWTELTQEVKKNKRAKDSDIKVYTDDIFSKMVKRGEVKEKGDAFFSRLKSFEKQFEIQSETYDKIAELNSDIEEIQKKISMLIDRMDNGEILEDEALFQIDMLQEDEELKQSERSSLRSSIKIISGNIYGMKRLINQFKKLEIFFNQYQNTNPAMFYAMFSHVNFNVFLDVLSFGASEEQIGTALAYYETVIENVQAQSKHLDTVDNRFEDSNRIIEKFETPHRKKSAQDTEKEEQAKKDRIAELRKKYKKPAPAPSGDSDKEEEQDDLTLIVNTISNKK